MARRCPWTVSSSANAHCSTSIPSPARAIGITIRDKNWGRGFGREAIALFVEYGFLQRNLRKVWLHVHGENRRAQGAYGACGFTEEGRLRAHVWSNGRYDDLLVMGLMVEQWRNHVTISAG